MTIKELGVVHKVRVHPTVERVRSGSLDRAGQESIADGNVSQEGIAHERVAQESIAQESISLERMSRQEIDKD